jgi:hypothetical protein
MHRTSPRTVPIVISGMKGSSGAGKNAATIFFQKKWQKANLGSVLDARMENILRVLDSVCKRSLWICGSVDIKFRGRRWSLCRRK